MLYNKTALRAQVQEVRDLWVTSLAAKDKHEMEKYERDLKKYREVSKPKNLEILKRMGDAIKKDQPFDTYNWRNELSQAPTKPSPTNAPCHSTVASLDTLIALLDTVQEGEITATALSRAGVKDIHRLLRKPC